MRYTEGYTGMLIDVQYVQKRGGSWRYRRKVPPALKVILGKGEIAIPLGSSEKEALRRYPRVHAEAERLLSAAEKQLHRKHSPAQATELENFRHAEIQVRSLKLDPEWASWESEVDREGIVRDVIADEILSKYPQDEDGVPYGITDKDGALLNSLYRGADAPRPEPTLEDARRLYLKDKVRDDRKKQLQLDRIFEYIKAAIGSDRKLSSLRRSDAREVRDYMLNGRAPSSVERYLNTVRALINYAIEEFDLSGVRNPFMKLEVEQKDKAEPDRLKKRGFTDEELAAVHARIVSMARTDLEHVWRILAGTGCRLAEVTGLRVPDVKLDHDIPHIDVEWHEDRRIKNAVSRRKVPLVGDALEAAKEAVSAAKGQKNLFPAYCRENGSSSASAALGKHVRACVTDSKVTTHSLRHRMKDRLRLAGVAKTDQDIILGHSSGGVGENYGSEEARLEVARRALEKALGS